MALTKVQSGLLDGGSGLNLSDSAPANTLVTTSAGNVGIGGTPDIAKFSVANNTPNGTYDVRIYGVVGTSTTYLDSDASNVYGAGLGEFQIQNGTATRPAVLSLGGSLNTDEGLGVINFFRSGNTDNYRARAQIAGVVTSTGTANQHGGFLAFRTAADGATNPSERMRIDSSGTLLMGCTGGGSTTGGARFYTDTSGDSMKIFNVQGSNSSITLLSCFSNASTPSNPTGTLRFNLVTNGGIQNFSGNNVNLSDIREKTDIELADNYLDKICSIPVKTFNYIDQNMDDDQGKTLGIIAQDVQTVAPELIKESNWGTKEEPKMRLSIYQTDLQYALMKCIQEQQAIITDLKARIETLEAK
jgi:hypothetical protein